MSLAYDFKALSLLNISPQFSQRDIKAINKIEHDNKLTLPSSIREWYCIDGHQELLQNSINITLNHVVLNIEEGLSKGNTSTNTEIDKEYFYLLEENQCVLHMAAKNTTTEDPPVYFRYNEPNEPWVMHAKTFSDWVHAIVWDSLCWDTIIEVNSASELHKLFSESTDIGPETLHMNMWLKGDRFYRVVHQGVRKIVLVQKWWGY